MTQAIVVRKIGDSLGIILPTSVLDTMTLKEGDELYVTATPNGLLITPYDPDFSETLEDAREFMQTHRDAFHRLAQ